MSAMTVSKSYAVLIGLEGYAKTRKKLKSVRTFLGRGTANGGKKERAGSWGKDEEKGGEGKMEGEVKVLVNRRASTVTA